MEKSNWKILFVFILFGSTVFGQVDENRYLVYFGDKEGTPYSVNEPEEFLSTRAIQRRLNQNIPITNDDLPVSPNYIQQVLNLGEVELIYELKWFNAILIETEDEDVLAGIESLPPVVGLQISPVITGEVYPEEPYELPGQPKNESDYGPSFNQIDMISGYDLHEQGFRGEGMWIGVFDGGFSLANQADALSDLFIEDRVIGTRNFVDGNSSVYFRSSHGTFVLSTMAGNMTDSLIGTAPEASYLLFITEDVLVERRIEEANWAAAAEYADSIGVDVINTSLGYTQFDVPEEDYSYELLDGNTTLITRASDKAASKGMLIVTSAGNSGNSEWFYISAPADGDSVLAVGALRPDTELVGFSSRGPRVDGAIKPNVVAQGFQAVVTDMGDGISVANGTSFSSPIIAGMAASLWQAVPNATAHEVFQAIEESAHLYANPNDSLGYGIPNFVDALEILQTTTGTIDVAGNSGSVGLFPNPIAQGEMLTFIVPSVFSANLNVAILDITGKTIYTDRLNVYGNRASINNLPIATTGVYLIDLRDDNGNRATGKLLLR